MTVVYFFSYIFPGWTMSDHFDEAFQNWNYDTALVSYPLLWWDWVLSNWSGVQEKVNKASPTHTSVLFPKTSQCFVMLRDVREWHHVLARLWPGILGVTSCCMQRVLRFTRWRHHGVSQRESASEGQTDESEWTREWDRNKSIVFGRTKGGEEKVISPNVYFKRTYCSSGHFGNDVFFQVWFGWLSTVCLTAVRAVDHEIIPLCGCGTMAWKWKQGSLLHSGCVAYISFSLSLAEM